MKKKIITLWIVTVFIFVLCPTQAIQASPKLKIEAFNSNRAETSNSIEVRFKITNVGQEDISVKDVSLRYYYTIDGEKPQSSSVDYAIIVSSLVTDIKDEVIRNFVKVEYPVEKADYYLQVGFKDTSRVLKPNQHLEISMRVSKNDWTNYTQSNDYSFNESAVTFAQWPKITAYISQELVWGTSPLPFITLAAQPKLEYTEGEGLDLSELKVKLLKSDDTQEDVKFADFVEKGLAVNIANGTLLTVSDSGSKIAITHTSSGKVLEIYGLIVKAKPKPITYTVTFINWNGHIIEEQIIEAGSSAEVPALPLREGYNFIGWDNTFNEVTSDLVITAQYEKSSPTVTDSERALADMDALSIAFATGDDNSRVTRDIQLPKTGSVYGSNIIWTSNNEDVIKINDGGDRGIVTCPAFGSGDTVVKINAEVFYNGFSDTKEFSLKVLQLQPLQPQKVTINISKIDLMKYGENNGSITVTAYGGSGFYEYSKDNGLTWQDSNEFKTLSPGTYNVLARDYVDPQNGSMIIQVIITSPSKPDDPSKPNNSNSGGGATGSGSIRLSDISPVQGNIDSTYIYRLEVSGGVGNYTFKITSGKLPEGLILSENGVISGTPVKSGTYQCSITVTDKNGSVSSHNFVIIINDSDAKTSNESINEEKGNAKKHIKLTIGKLEIKVDNESYGMDAMPFIDKATNRTLVPIRFICEVLGAKVTWLPETRQALITEGDMEILLTLGSKEVMINGVIMIIDTEVVIVPPGRIFVPLRIISEILGAKVEYNQESKEISIEK